MAEPLFADAGIQDRKINRMEDAVSQAGQAGEHHQGGIAVARGQPESSQGEKRQAHEQDGPGAEPVYREATDRLAYARNDEEHRHHHAEFRIAQAELQLEPGKQRGKDEVEKVRQRVHQTHEPDGAKVLSKREVWGGHGGAERKRQRSTIGQPSPDQRPLALAKAPASRLRVAHGCSVSRRSR